MIEVLDQERVRVVELVQGDADLQVLLGERHVLVHLRRTSAQG